MDKLPKILLPLGLLCLIGACGIAVLNLIAIIAASFGFMQLFYFFQLLRLPYWSVALPAIGILSFFPLALRLAFTRKSPAEEQKVVGTDELRHAARRWGGKFGLRPV